MASAAGGSGAATGADSTVAKGEFDALKKLASKNGKDAKAKPDEDIMQFSVAKLSGGAWKVTYTGPEYYSHNPAGGTARRLNPYRGAAISVEFTLGATYPAEIPTVRFLTSIYHPQVQSGGSDAGKICRPDSWKAQMGKKIDMASMINLVYAMLQNPSPSNSPLNTEAASKYKDNLDKFEEEARRSVLPAESGDDDDDDDEGAAFGDM